MKPDEPYPARGSGHQYAGQRRAADRVRAPSGLDAGLASCDVCASAETLAELEQVLEREKFDRISMLSRAAPSSQ